MFLIGCRKNATATEPESQTFEIYDKKAKTWHSARLDAWPSVRGFGPWVASAGFSQKRAFNAPMPLDLKNEAESPGKEYRKRVLNPGARERDQFTIDDLFQRSPFQFTGSLDLYNIRSRQKYSLQTGQGDSEILLVDGNTVYYRVNDTLYRAAIGQTALGSPVKIVTDPSVQLAHWAFFGPPVQ